MGPKDFENALKRYDPFLFVRWEPYTERDVRGGNCPPHALGSGRYCIFRKGEYGKVYHRMDVVGDDGWSPKRCSFRDLHKYVEGDIGRFPSFEAWYKDRVERRNQLREERDRYEFEQWTSGLWSRVYDSLVTQTFVGGLPAGSGERFRQIREEIKNA